MDYKIEFTNKEISPWSGILMMIRMLERMDFEASLNRLSLPPQGSNRGYSPAQLVKQFMTSVWCGANKFEHTEVTRQDEVIRKFWNFKRMARHKAFQRFFNKFNQATHQRVLRSCFNGFLRICILTILP